MSEYFASDRSKRANLGRRLVHARKEAEVDPCQRFAALCARHRDTGSRYEVAERFMDHMGLSEAEKKRVRECLKKLIGE